MNASDLSRLKQSIDLVAVVQSRGVKLVKQGKDFVGLCPFHKEKTPSFHVTPSKNLFNCLGCHVGGSIIDFIMRKDGLTKSEAVAWLKANSGATFTRPAVVPAAPARILKPEDAEALLQRVVKFYVRTLRKDPAGMGYLNRRNLSGTTLEFFQVGYSNGSLLRALPKSGDLIRNLKTLGVLNAKGQEHFRGCVTVPIFDATGKATGIYGRRVTDAEPSHLYLPGPHRGVFNGAAAKTSQSLFITEAIFDALSLWQAGFKNAIALYGAHGWTDDHAQLLKANGTTEVYLALDNDKAGEEATARLQNEILPSLVKQIHVVKWPEGVKDANEFFASRSPADFEKQCLEPLQPAQPPKSEVTEKLGDEEISMTPDGFAARYGQRRYELHAIEQQKQARLRATVKAFAAAGGGAPGGAHCFHIDTVDFYVSRSRRIFISEVARLFRETVEVIEADVNRLIGQVEAYAQKQLAESHSQVVLVSDTDKAEALKLGRHPDLAGEILRDMEKLGLIGEATNKLIGYLTMTSRKMPDPLALLTLSGSGSGKSHLQDTILCLCPDEDLIKLTSLTDRALFYKGEDSLKNKVLAVEELAGAMGADYAIRNLISAKKLVIESTIKNPLTGKLETQVNTVNGPTAVFQTTTNPRTDAETRSRFVVISVDESPEQTRAILAAQRQSHTREGWQRRLAREAILKRHQSFQRLLRPLKIINPFEPLLSYPDESLLVRRDQPKYLNLILAVTFLYQLQRPVQNDTELGDHIETTLDDIAIANELAHELFGHSLDDLSRPSRELLRLVYQHVQRQAAASKTGDVTFNRRELREAFKWGDTRLRTHLDELVEMEYVVPLSGRFGQTYQYRLVYEPTDEPGRFLSGLKSVEQLRKTANLAGVLTHLAPQNGHLAPTSQVAIREVKNGVPSNGNGHFMKPAGNLAPVLGGHIPEKHQNGRNGL
ncbi:MAG: CHC2 zinc finger domain-containing protein [Verrucomicrobiia bacterium]|jgi:DNA primase catalytic core